MNPETHGGEGDFGEESGNQRELRPEDPGRFGQVLRGQLQGGAFSSYRDSGEEVLTGSEEMSEELVQRGLSKKGISLIDYEYYPTHSTSLKQYKEAKIIPPKNYGKYEGRKPDGLIVDRRNKNDIRVLCVVEYKDPVKFQTEKQKKSATEQCNDVCQILGASCGVITDGIVTLWINPKQPDEKNTYKDETTSTIRSYSYIIAEDKQKVGTPFSLPEKEISKLSAFDEKSRETYELILKILDQITETNSIFQKTREVDPLNLAKGVWQDIYVNTGKDPTKCLYNVVELFIFKFLSDMGILKKPYDFDSLLAMYQNGSSNKDVLAFYARNSRVEIIKLFPRGSDGTTIMNGTIFVNSKGNPVDSQANLFRNSLNKYADFESLKNIKKEFKTKLFETFLKQSQDKSRLGQFFTPRKVVRSIVQMADAEQAEFICDPFCGVGGFVLEPLQIHPQLQKNFNPSFKGKKVKFLGLDKGNDEDEHRTIILAKANMLIYLSDVIQKTPTLTKEYALMFNETFKLLSDSNLGTFKIKFEAEEEKPDLILSNSPYVKKGSRSLRNEIVEEGLKNDYIHSGVGVEGLALKWVINNLRKGGKTFLVVPNGIMDNFANKELRDHLKEEFFVNCIISLPMKTFFNTNKKTYILGLQKKDESSETQDTPVFCYLASSIGEELNANRFEIEENDLEQAKNLFNQFKGNKKNFNTDDPRCKLISFENFDANKYWIIEQFWKEEELIKLGIVEEKRTLDVKGYASQLDKLVAKIKECKSKIETIEKEIQNIDFKEVCVTDVFRLELGDAKYTKEYINNNPGEYSVFSAQTLDNGVIGKISHYDWDVEGLTWSIDGSYPGMVFYRKGKFSMTTHCGLMLVRDEYKGKIDYKYFMHLLNNHLPNFVQGQGNKRLKKTHIEQDVTEIKLPVNAKGQPDLQKQREIANKYAILKAIKEEISADYQKLLDFGILIS